MSMSVSLYHLNRCRPGKGVGSLFEKTPDPFSGPCKKTPDPFFGHNPHRPGRLEPRVKKRRPKPYDLMNQPRHVLRKRLLDKANAA
jgi:hypothetical protein